MADKKLELKVGQTWVDENGEGFTILEVKIEKLYYGIDGVAHLRWLDQDREEEWQSASTLDDWFTNGELKLINEAYVPEDQVKLRFELAWAQGRQKMAQDSVKAYDEMLAAIKKEYADLLKETNRKLKAMEDRVARMAGTLAGDVEVLPGVKLADISKFPTPGPVTVRLSTDCYYLLDGENKILTRIPDEWGRITADVVAAYINAFPALTREVERLNQVAKSDEKVMKLVRLAYDLWREEMGTIGAPPEGFNWPELEEWVKQKFELDDVEEV